MRRTRFCKEAMQMQKKTRRFERTAASVCKEYAILTLATLVMSAGTYLFKFPNNFSFGGVTGLAVVLSAVSPLSAGTYNFNVLERVEAVKRTGYAGKALA